MRRRRDWGGSILVPAALLGLCVLAAGCAGKQPPVARPTSPAGTAGPVVPPPTRPAEPPGPSATAPPAPAVAQPTVEESRIDARSLDDINRDSPFQPVFFEFDSSEINAAAQGPLNANGDLLRRNGAWVVTIEGHCDERGTAEYNLALGERRALAAKNYLVALGISAERVKTVSYGKEFPFDPGKSEEAYARNRRAHFVLTGK